MVQTETPPPATGPADQGAVPPPAPPAVPAPVAPAAVPEREMNPDARIWATFCHIAGLAFLLPAVPGIGCIVGPLIVWAIRKERFPFVNEQGKEAINFQTTMFIYGVVALIITVLVHAVVILFLLLVLADILLTIIAAVRANDGFHHRYPKPFIIRFIK